jgi:predicted nucleotidyltransferase component of viral defense system
VEAKVMTPFQARVLELLFADGLGQYGYCFTGGTALTEFYLQHRHSDDLDIFTRVHRTIRSDYLKIRPNLEREGLEVRAESEQDEFARFFVWEPDQSANELRVELARYAGAQLGTPNTLGSIIVDSFEDIAVNKVVAIYGRSDVKDLVDLFFILQESEFTLDYLIGRAKEKEADFDREDTLLEFATKLLGVKDLQLHRIRMIKPLTMEDLQSFLIPKAEALIERLRPVGRG